MPRMPIRSRGESALTGPQPRLRRRRQRPAGTRARKAIAIDTSQWFTGPQPRRRRPRQRPAGTRAPKAIATDTSPGSPALRPPASAAPAASRHASAEGDRHRHEAGFTRPSALAGVGARASGQPARERRRRSPTARVGVHWPSPPPASAAPAASRHASAEGDRHRHESGFTAIDLSQRQPGFGARSQRPSDQPYGHRAQQRVQDGDDADDREQVARQKATCPTTSPTAANASAPSALPRTAPTIGSHHDARRTRPGRRRRRSRRGSSVSAIRPNGVCSEQVDGDPGDEAAMAPRPAPPVRPAAIGTAA